MKKHLIFIIAALLFLAVANNDCYGQGGVKKAGTALKNVGKGVKVNVEKKVKEIEKGIKSGVKSSVTGSKSSTKVGGGGSLNNPTQLPFESPLKHIDTKKYIQNMRRSTPTIRDNQSLSGKGTSIIIPYMLPQEIKAEDVVSVSADRNKIVVSTFEGEELDVFRKTGSEGWRKEKKEKEKKKQKSKPSNKTPIPNLCLTCPTQLYDME